MGLRQKLRPRLRTVDRVALGFGAVVIVLAAASGGDEPTDASRDLDGLAALLLAAAGAAVMWGTRFPGLVAAAALGLTFAWYGIGYTSGLVNIATLAAFYLLGSSDGQGRKLAVTVAAILATLTTMVLIGDEGWHAAFTAAGYLVMAVLFGELIRNRRLLVEQYLQRAERAEADAERRVVEERLQIARDVHDVLAHTVSVMTVQAGVAADAIDRDRAAAAGALDAIRDAGREAMDEVRATVAVLRSGTGPTATAPAPRIERLPELVDAAREHGLAVEVAVDRSDRQLPELVELTAYRVVQEALTNVLRHARATTAVVTIAEDQTSLTVEVRDDGSAAGEPGPPGFGLRGMAERVESIGGELHHGRDRHQGWVVRATLPLRTSDAGRAT